MPNWRLNFTHTQRKYELQEGNGAVAGAGARGNTFIWQSGLGEHEQQQQQRLQSIQNISKRFNNEFRNKISMKIDIKVPTKDKQNRKGVRKRGKGKREGSIERDTNWYSCVIELA